ncbi:putative disease resistance protein RGA3 [Abrus precatorius]|uniref:Disease resistance protein RGA3 n=1 Tax=Abrus precatorius TaxID=3816 RepID=A0A8B8K0A2_ABRPR|nr:putative disease resistance protein RGA3 [Abrus precatorius]
MRHKLDAGHEKQVNKALYSFSSSNRIDFPIQMTEEIKKTRESFDAVVEDMYKLNLCPRSIVVKQTDSGWRETCSFVLETDIIGRDDTKKEIISLLRHPHENQKVSVVAIVGLGGLGKTALAQLSVTRCQIADGSSLDYLQEELRENLSGKKYLLVLDDIWNERHDKWDELRKYLMCGAQDSKILVTTRSENVANAMTVSTSYPLKGLTDEASWRLLKNIAFEDDSKMNQNLESIGKEIAKKCKGVPLAVRALGGLLRGQNEQSEWEKGYLICSTKEQHVEEIGNQFVKIFLMNSIFQDAKNDEYGVIISFKMHDLMHDLSILVAGNDCCYLDSTAEKVESSPVHVSLESCEAIHLLKSLDPSRLRTLILPNVFQEEEYLSVITNFKYLRVLKMQQFCAFDLSDSIENLKHLRYLALGQETSVSKSMSNLIFLQTLKLKNYDEKSFFEVVTKLVNLRWLDYGSLSEMAFGWGKFVRF